MLNISQNRLDNVRGLSSLQALIAVNLGAWADLVSVLSPPSPVRRLGAKCVARDVQTRAVSLLRHLDTGVVVPVPCFSRRTGYFHGHYQL